MVGTKEAGGVGVDASIWGAGDSAACKEGVSDKQGGEGQGRTNGDGEEKHVNVVFWSGGKDSYLALLFLEQRLMAASEDKEPSNSR